MTKISAALVAVLGFALLVGVTRAEEPVYTDIKKQADSSGKKSWDDLTKDGKALAKKYDDLLDIMTAFKPKDSKTPGIGVDASNMGIEAKIISISKRPMPAAELEKQAKDLIRMAEVTKAIASISTHQFPEKLPPGKKATPSEWTKWSKQMNDASDDLIKAVKEKKPVDVRNAAAKLNGTCIECHDRTRAGVGN